MKVLGLILLLFISGFAYSQQDALYSQYAYNQYAINTAYAGSRSSFSGVALHRSQWIGIKDAPSLQSFTIHSPLSRTSLAYGLSVTRETLGPVTNSTFNFSLGYHIKLKKAKLSFALRGGVYQAILNRDLLTFQNESDVFRVGGSESTLVPNIDFGTYYYSSRFFAGIALNHLTNETFKFVDYPDNINWQLKTHIYFHTGYVFNLKKQIKFKPTLLVKLTEGTLPNVDLAFNFMFYKKFWLGLSLRNTSSINFLSEWNIKEYFRIGYAYDYSINKLTTYTSGSHELFLGFDFNLKKSKNSIISPRYL
ncbi:MAG: type IX secretion system membrane protein PorP/SprF [Crocinitomicaceae bacterium]